MHCLRGQARPPHYPGLPLVVILSAAKDPLRRTERAPTQWILRCAQDDGTGVPTWKWEGLYAPTFTFVSGHKAPPKRNLTVP